MSSTVVEKRVKLARPIRRLMTSRARFLLIEGAMRASKTWGCLIHWRKRLEDYPGIALVMARWKQEDLDTKLVPDYFHVCDLMGLPYGTWDAKQQCYEFANGSRLYAINLKASELSAVHSKPRGFTISGIYISQLEEVPHAVAREWMLRLSQPGYPKQFLGDANPVHDGHWIANEWPTDNSKLPEYEYLTASIWDNAHNLDPEDIAAAERLYPVGHPMRAAKLEGLRGANTEGEPVYNGYFDPSQHVDDELQPWPHAPILVGWDFGSKHPAVSVGQFLPWGAFWSLGAIMGENVMLEWFAPRVLAILKEWCGDLPQMHCGDPAGDAQNSQGVSINAKKVLAGLNVHLRTQGNSNDLRVRYACIQTLGGYMLRRVRPFVGSPNAFTRANYEEPAFLLKPRGLLISRKKEQAISLIEQALGGGYIWDDSFHGTGNLANIRRPLKDGFFDHSMNATEYKVHNFTQIRVSVEDADGAIKDATHEAKLLARMALEAQQIDPDEDAWGDRVDGFVPGRPDHAGAFVGRGGY